MAASDPMATQRDRPADIENDLEGTGFDDPHVVGRGGFGVVYRCRQQALNRHVAIKVLTATADLEPENFERFVREQQAMGALGGHPNIVQILQVGTTASGFPYLVMPYHGHGSLEDRIRTKGRLPVDEAVRIAIKLAGALETAHRAAILHRDIKPGNVLLTDYDEPQLTDFGIARIEGGFETTAGVVTGSPAFTAPEVLRAGNPSIASDVYGLGATLFCMITGHAAFERRSGEQLVAQFLRISAEPLPDLRPEGIPADVCAVIEASMAHDPTARPQSAGEFGERLRDILRAHGAPVEEMTLPTTDGGDPDSVRPQESVNTSGSMPVNWSASGRHSTTPPTPDTKYRPAVSARSLVHRERLIEALRASDRPRLTVIHAPAGFGKSTLALQWAKYLVEEQDVAVAWLNADRDDNNLVWFLTHLVEAVHRACPALAPSLQQVLEEQGESAARFVLTTLVNTIHEHRQRVAVVIDDWHRVTDPAAVGALRFLLENGCHHLQIIVTSRSSDGLPLATMRVRNELVEIDSTALRFDIPEASSFLVDVSGLPLANNEVAELRASTEGWVAALQLASLSLRGHHSPAELINHMSGRHHTIAEYLAENVLDAVEPDLLDALLETALPERLSGDLASALTGRRRGQALLEEIERRDLFLRRIDEDGEWFRYHHLFVQFLRQRLERDYPERVQTLHRAAADWFAEHGMLSEAIDHALTIGDDEFAVELVEAHAMDRVQHAQFSTLLGLVAKLPSAKTATRPRLQIALAWAYMLLRKPGEMTATLRLVESSMTASTQVPDSDLASEASLIGALARALGDNLVGVDEVVTDCLGRTDTLNPWTLSAAASAAGFLAIYRFEFDRARAWHHWATPYHQQISGSFSLMYSHCLAGLAAREQLDVGAAEQHFRTALQIATTTSGTQSYAARLAGALLGDLLYERDELTAGEQLLDEVHELGIEGGIVEFMMAAYGTGARIKALHGDLDAARQRLDEGARAARTLALPRLSARVTNEQVRLGLRTTVAEAETDGDNGIAKLTAELNEDSAIRLLRNGGSPDQLVAACERAAKLRASIDGVQRPRAALYAQLLLAACLAAAGRIDEGKDALVPALATCADVGLIRPLRDEGAPISSLIRVLELDLSEGNWKDLWPPVPWTFLTVVLDS
ncbi:protein kinase [Nocardia sp. ET3-3]|uniref:Serine/threonine-protein kinase PknK n=1 Tax=Nocardia terrae TaxID=2675851 RepID=A0A7K1V2F2_9NOCA|nr:serine/threonine-protein kinase [Nocardia terrae]MVU80820.1 protein kinase [Nocardia terrae]